MPTMTDRIVMDYWNGRPTEWLSIIDEVPHLHWLLLGHSEPFDVWLTMRLTPMEAEELRLATGDSVRDLETWLGDHPGSWVTLELRIQGEPVVSVEQDNPGGADGVRALLTPFLGMISNVVRAGGAFAPIAQAASVDVQDLLDRTAA